MRPPCARQCSTRCSSFEIFKGNVFHPAELRAGRAKTHADACVMPALKAGDQRMETISDIEPLSRGGGRRRITLAARRLSTPHLDDVEGGFLNGIGEFDARA